MNTLLKKEKNFNSICHSCVSENPVECKSLLNIMPLDSRGKPENDKEVGRSMVEMLGVLAVMGVLSVAGIAGYNSAMNRHRANELINEAQKRAVSVAMQTVQGRETYSIAEFINPTGYQFGIQKYGDKYFFITLKKSDNNNIDSAICQQMKNAVGSASPIRKISTNCDMFYFNNDLSKEGNAYDDNMNAKSCSDNDECGFAFFCSSGKCISRCAPGAVWGSSISIGADFCADGIDSCQCRVLTENLTCTSNDECLKGDGCCVADELGVKRCAAQIHGEFACVAINKGCSFNADCDVPNEYCSVASNTKSLFPNLGTCLPVKIRSTNLTADGKEIVRSEKWVASWWAADNFCKAQGRRLLTLSDLGLPEERCKIDENSCQIESEEWNNIKQNFEKRYYWLGDEYKSHSHHFIISFLTGNEGIGELGYYSMGGALCI